MSRQRNLTPSDTHESSQPLSGFTVMTGERGDECVCVEKEEGGTTSAQILKMLFVTHENFALSAQGTRSPPCSRDTIDHYLFLRCHPQRTRNWRWSLQEWTSTLSSPLPVLCLLTERHSELWHQQKQEFWSGACQRLFLPVCLFVHKSDSLW